MTSTKLPVLTIDRSGTLNFDGTVHIAIGPKTKMNDACVALAPLGFELDDKGNGYCWVAIKQALSFGGQVCSASLCFHGQALEYAMFGVDLPGDTQWENWPTEQTSKNHVEFFRKAFHAQLGCKVRDAGASFSWGSVFASFDVKGFCCTAGLHYKLKPKKR